MKNENDIERLADDGCPHHEDLARPAETVQEGDWDNDLVVSLTADGWATLREADNEKAVRAVDELSKMGEFGGISGLKTIRPLTAHTLFRLMTSLVPDEGATPYDGEAKKFCDELLGEMDKYGYVVAGKE